MNPVVTDLSVTTGFSLFGNVQLNVPEYLSSNVQTDVPVKNSLDVTANVP